MKKADKIGSSDPYVNINYWGLNDEIDLNMNKNDNNDDKNNSHHKAIAIKRKRFCYGHNYKNNKINKKIFKNKKKINSTNIYKTKVSTSKYYFFRARYETLGI